MNLSGYRKKVCLILKGIAVTTGYTYSQVYYVATGSRRNALIEERLAEAKKNDNELEEELKLFALNFGYNDRRNQVMFDFEKWLIGKSGADIMGGYKNYNKQLKGFIATLLEKKTCFKRMSILQYLSKEEKIQYFIDAIDGKCSIGKRYGEEMKEIRRRRRKGKSGVLPLIWQNRWRFGCSLINC